MNTERKGRGPSGNVPSGFFGAGGVVGQMTKPITLPAVPLDWLKQQPSTRAWWADSITANVTAGEIIDLALQLEGGFEGVCVWLMLIGKSWPSNAISGTAPRFRPYLNEAPYFQTRMQHALVLDETGFISMLEHSDGDGQTWGEVEIWLPEQSNFSIGYVNPTGTAHPMGWMARGYYWPVVLRDEWVTRGWRK